MLKWIESTGRSEEAAVAAALVKLGLDRDEVSVEVLERAKTGFLGIGSCPAKVKVTFEGPDEPAPIERKPAPTERKPAPTERKPAPTERKPAPIERKPAPTERKPAPTERKPAPAERKPAPTEHRPAPTAAPVAAADLTSDECAQRIDQFLTGLLAHIGIEAAPQIGLSAEGNYEVELVGKELGSLIGRRGETLDAIQQLTGYAVNHGQSRRVRIHVDAEHYRQKREESLIKLALKVADKVVKYRRNVTLEPMNAYERHVIHTALQEVPDVSTYSIGTEPNRRTVVGYSCGEHR